MKRLAQGFTLVELLIVIALLGVIATIVIAAINPIEQANRAADAGMKADASQLLSAIQRYYATHNVYPWNAASCTGSTNCDTGALSGPEDAFNTSGNFVSADDLAVGICGASGATCKASTTTAQGELISALELQKTFLNKSWIGATGASQKLWVGKAAGASSPVYICWIPKASSNRQVLIASSLTNANKMYDVTAALSANTGLPAVGACTAVSGTGAGGWLTGACAECVPE